MPLIRKLRWNNSSQNIRPLRIPSAYIQQLRKNKLYSPHVHIIYTCPHVCELFYLNSTLFEYSIYPLHCNKSARVGVVRNWSANKFNFWATTNVNAWAERIFARQIHIYMFMLIYLACETKRFFVGEEDCPVFSTGLNEEWQWPRVGFIL